MNKEVWGQVSRVLLVLLGMLPANLAAKAIDKLIDAVEDLVAKSGTQIDDAVVLPLCGWVRQQLNIPDEDEG